jgi:hypothetical protein
VSITSPASGTTYTTAQTVTISASASDNVGVTKVEFYDGATLKGTDTSSPYDFAWTISSSDNGTHNWTAKAYDAANNTATSSAVSLTVDIPASDTTPPTVNIDTPANDATVSGTVNVSASASDNVGVTRVEFFVDGTLASTDTTSPYDFSWDTAGASNGSHTLMAKAYDAAGNVGTSATVSVTVNNSAIPAAPSNLTATAISKSQINLSWTDNSGNEDGFKVERAPVSKGKPGVFVLIATLGSNVTTYNNTGLSAATSYAYRVKAFNANGESAYSNQATAKTLRR